MEVIFVFSVITANIGITGNHILASQTFNRSKLAADKGKTLAYLEKCLIHWKNIIRLTSDRYEPMPYVSIDPLNPRWSAFTSFHWSHFLTEVEADIKYARNK